VRLTIISALASAKKKPINPDSQLGLAPGEEDGVTETGSPVDLPNIQDPNGTQSFTKVKQRRPLQRLLIQPIP